MTGITHLYSSGGVIYHDGKVLAIKWLSKDCIEFPKGTIEPGETTWQACIREVREETGYSTKIIQPLGEVTFEYDQSGQRYRKTVSNYLLELTESTEIPTPNREPGEDFTNVWLSPSEAATQLTFESGRDTLGRALAFDNAS